MNALCRIARGARATTAGLLLATVLGTGAALAQPSPQSPFQTWPQKTVRFVIPLPPGSGTDLAGRLVAERLTERWGQPVVVENRQGADGIPAVSSFLSARDNHTFLLSFAGVITFNHCCTSACLTTRAPIWCRSYP